MWPFDILKKKAFGLAIAIQHIFAFKLTADCGHETYEADIVTAFGESVKTTLLIKDGKTPFCHRCLEKMAIKCAWCEEIIFIGDPITLYTPAKNDFKIPDHAVAYETKPLKVVGCLRATCADSGVDRAGFWHPPGKVRRVPSPLELAIQTGRPACCNDLSKRDWEAKVL